MYQSSVQPTHTKTSLILPSFVSRRMLALSGPGDNRAMFAESEPSLVRSERLCRSAPAPTGASRASGTRNLLSIDHVPLMEPSLLDTET